MRPPKDQDVIFICHVACTSLKIVLDNLGVAEHLAESQQMLANVHDNLLRLKNMFGRVDVDPDGLTKILNDEYYQRRSTQRRHE